MIAVLLWWLVIQLLALAVLPLAWRLFAWLPGRGYPLAKALGILLVSYLLWLGAVLHLLPNTFGGAAAALLGVAAASAWLGRAGLARGPDGAPRPLVAWLRENWRLVLATELLFAAALAGWAAFRAFNPDIAGTEKPMEFAFINGVLRSPLFPPQDPWLSGYGISYYYFGYVMLAMLIRLTGVDPAVGFNLGVALWFALVAVGAFGVVYDLVRLAGSWKLEAGSKKLEAGDTLPVPRSTSHERRAIRYGLLGALFTALLGNLEGVFELAYNKSLLPLAFLKWLDIKQMFDSPPTGQIQGPFYWWWRASRVIHDKDLLGNTVEVIDEFPGFSFVLGDMHPHVLALPFAILAVALALNLFLAARSASRKPDAGNWKATGATGLQLRASGFWHRLSDATGLGAPGIVLYALALGGLGFLNTWDFPVYIGLAMLALGAGWALAEGLSWGVAGRAAAGGVMLAALGWLLYLPFYIGFQSQLGGLLPNLFFPSRFSQFFVMFGTFLVILTFFLALVSRGAGNRRVASAFLNALPVALLALPLALAAVLGLMVILPQGKEFIQTTLNTPAVQAHVGANTVGGLIGLIGRVRVGSPWTWLALAGLIAWAVGAAWAGLARWSGEAEERKSGGAFTGALNDRSTSLPLSDLFTVLMIALALILTLVPEFVYLRDQFGSRMNTVFKFYYQAWMLLALASAYGLSRLAERTTPILLRAPALVLATLLVLIGLWYPLAAIPSKADNFRGEASLDGLAYLRRNDPADMAAIEWLRANVAPDAVVLEASGGSYGAEGRISMATGNPTLLGWDGHERQWRGEAGYDKLAAGRPEALEQIYRTARTDELPALLERWGVDYVLVGETERNKYKISDAALARLDQALKLVYDRDGVRIYAR